MANQTNYYEVLGVSRTASESEIRNAYRQLAKERHPDRPGGSEREFALLQEAHTVLADPGRRKQHNEALDLAHAADQLAELSDLDWSQLEDEVSNKRRERDSGGSSGGPGFGERLRGRFRRPGGSGSSGRSSGGRGQGRSQGRTQGSSRGRYQVREARWYEPQDFDPEPITLKSGATVFGLSLLAFVVVGQLGLWASGLGTPGVLSFMTALGPFMFVLYTATGLVAAYLAFRSAGYAAVALVFVAGLVVNGSAPDGGAALGGFLQAVTVGIGALLAVIYFGNRRDARSRR